jgi:hypothetical protein
VSLQKCRVTNHHPNPTLPLVKLAFTICLLTASAVLAYVSPRLFMMLAGVTAAAIAVRYMQQTQPDPLAQQPDKVEGQDSDEPTTSSREQDAVRVRQALDLGRLEVGQDPSGKLAAIELHTNIGKAEVHVGYAGEVPFVGLRQPMGDDTEMAFVIRRRHSTLGLPRLVDNTPISTAKFEYRLRTIPLTGELAGAFDAGTNRPRLFRELLASGFEDALADVLYHPRYRLEDLIYGGDALSVALHPAADPTHTPWLRETLDYSAPLAAHVRHFIDVTHIPSAQS